MLSVARCREILGRDSTLSDAEVEELRDLVYGFADIALRIAREKHDEGCGWNSREQRWEERAAKRLQGGALLPRLQPRPAEGSEPRDPGAGLHRVLPLPGHRGGGSLRGAGGVGEHDGPHRASED